MGVFSSILASLFISAAMQGAEEMNKEIPATPQHRMAPAYPVACVPSEKEVVKPQTVIVLFDVTKEGTTENVRIAESSDDCFNDVVMATVRSWVYEPRMIDGKARAQIDTETTFTFIFDEETQAVDFDARVLYRAPPKYPGRCQTRTGHTVMIEFDIDTEGVPQNIKVIESTRNCFNKTSIAAASKWRYLPKTVSGKPVIRTGVRTTIEFILGQASPGMEYRATVHSRLRRARRLLLRGDYDKAMEMLEGLEAKYGDSLSRVELASFLRLRASVHIEMGEYAKALDDFRIVQNMGLGDQANEAVGNMILQLEAAIAAEESNVEETDNEAEPSQ